MTEPTVLRPFTGLRIADFAWVIAGPLASMYFSLHGADVIHIESRGRPDVLRQTGQPFMGGPVGPDTSGYFAMFNHGKRGITLNLQDPRAVELAKRIVATCDIVTENFVAGTMNKLGLGYEELRAVRPDLIMVSMGLAGQTGPERSYKGFGTVIQGAAGITHLTGWPDRPPVGTGVAYTDFVASHIAAFALLCAVEHRRRTGEGQYIDLSQQEGSMWMLDAALLEYTVNGRVQQRAGNRHPAAAPHGAFPCGGHDEERPGHQPDDGGISQPTPAYPLLPPNDDWVAIAVFTDAHWQGLRAAMDQPEWSSERRFQTVLGRKRHEDELERLVADWTWNLSTSEVVSKLREHGVPASVVASSADVAGDPQLAARDHWLPARHPNLGDFPFDAMAYRLNSTRIEPLTPAPLMGQHNQQVMEDLLGLSADEYQTLEASGVLR